MFLFGRTDVSWYDEISTPKQGKLFFFVNQKTNKNIVVKLVDSKFRIGHVMNKIKVS